MCVRVQLTFRTLNRDLRQPDHNDDYLAVKLRDELVPVRSWALRHLPWFKYQLRSGLENRFLGVPGCINFIDARTKWFDNAVTRCTAAGEGGMTQVQ
ncbi:hypothetical protein FOA52_014720 [Chlamydomonas sp. UWO 241]|nr:hypothetical protein FOA52_014720 [Chlamydomonas sp. UWO 241]